MLLFTVTGWIYFKDPSGTYVPLVVGRPAWGTNLLVPVPGVPTGIQRTAAEKFLPDVRARLPDLIEQMVQDQVVWSVTAEGPV